MTAALAWLTDHPLVCWFAASSVANVLVDVVGAADTTVGRLAKAVGLDLRRAIGSKQPPAGDQ